MEEFRLLSVEFGTGEDSRCASTHAIFCKEHAVRQSAKLTPNHKTLFTLGWPPYTTPQAVEELFSRVGHVTSVYLQPSPGPVDCVGAKGEGSGFKVGYVVFSQSSEVKAALRLCVSVDSPSHPPPIMCVVPPRGVHKWSHDYMCGRPTVTSLERLAEVGVALYDEQREEATRIQERAGQPDEEGWVTVTRKTPKHLVRGRPYYKN